MNGVSNVEHVKSFLRGQNLEQVGDADAAILLYEEVVAASFDSSGPYDRLIALYADRAQHVEVVRVAELALANVKTYADKKAWYERMRAEALRAQTKVPGTVPKAPRGGPIPPA
jgi:hypothetical protein